MKKFALAFALIGSLTLVSCGNNTDPQRAQSTPMPNVAAALKAEAFSTKFCKQDRDCGEYHVCSSGRCYAQ